MRIGITVDMRHSMFSAGHPNSCIAICEAMQVGGHEVIFLKKDEKIWWDDVLEIMGNYRIEDLKLCSNLDLLIEVGFHLTPLERTRISKRVVWYCRKPALFTDMELTVYAHRIEGRNMEGVSEIWLADIFNNSEDIEYLKVLYPFLEILVVPWLWSPTLVETHRKEKQSPVWPQVLEHISENTPWSLHITESNASNTSSCILPLLIIKDSGITKISVHNTEMLSSNKFFKENIIKNIELPDTLQLVGRQRTIDWSHEPNSIIVSHSRFIGLKVANLEAVWVGIPLIHNSDILKDLGCGLEKLYYNKNNIEGGSKAITIAMKYKNKDIYMNNLDVLTELRKRILYKFSPEANATQWLSLLEKKIDEKKVNFKKKPVYKILFTDMWADFNPEYNMFTLAMQGFLKDYEVIGTSIKGDHNVHIFGPFGSEWLSIEGPKVHFTGENTGPIEHPSVKLNIGYRRDGGDNYLRMPLWMFEIDLFNADLNKIQNPLPLPIEACTKKYTNNREKFCAFIVSNPKNSIRNSAFEILNSYKPVDSAGRLYNNVGDKIFAGLGGGGGELKKHEFLKDYKFCLCYENEGSEGYVTEKLFHAKASGCIPIYWGASDVVKDFDPRGFIHITDQNDLITRVKEIDEDDEKWLQMAQVPALTDEKVVEVRKTFEKMCQMIVENNDIVIVTSATLNFIPSLERWVENIKLHKSSVKNLRAIIYIGSDVSDEHVKFIKDDYIQVKRFPVETPDDFTDFWNPQHFAWKLWILNEMSCNILIKGSTVFYMDCGSVIVRWPIQWIEQVKKEKISFLEDDLNKNRNWCHKEFCHALEVTDEELNSGQIAACLIMFKSGYQFVIDFFSEALRLGSIRKIIVGEKWSGIGSDGKHFGHRHDQSILSILSIRNKIHKIPINTIYNHDSARATYYNNQYIYVHRGNYKSHIPLAEGIDDAYVINLDRRSDRLKSFVEHHPYFRGKVRRHKAVDGRSLELTSDLARLLKPNDFFWKKAVTGCFLSHLKLWTMLNEDSKEINSYLIMEDDARLKGDWSKEWLKVQGKLPSEWECVYLGGVLPPNREGFNNVLEKTDVPGLCRIAPNTFFGQSVPSRQFHFCAYAYVLSRRGVRRIMNAIEQHDGIWTSADHVLFNSLNKENVFVLNPLVAGASQDNDPVYVNSDFNDFSRIDKFDSDLWNNDERFNRDEIGKELKVLQGTPFEASELLRSIFNKKKDLKQVPEAVLQAVPEALSEKVVEVVDIPLEILSELPLELVAEPHSLKATTINAKGEEIPNVRFICLKEHKLDFSKLYESEWLFSLFGGLKNVVIEYVDETTPVPTDCPIFILQRPHVLKATQFLLEWAKKGGRFKLLHMSDELTIEQADPLLLYKLPNCVSVLRTYIRDDFPPGTESKIKVIPLGYRWSPLKIGKHPLKWTPQLPFRENHWCFFGTNWNGRSEILKPLLLAKLFNVSKFYPTWNDPSALSKAEYIKEMTNSIFVPCPDGVNPETFRFYEALEAGCIPLIVKTEKNAAWFKWVSNYIPLVANDSWEDAVRIMYTLITKPERLEIYREQILNGWVSWTNSLRQQAQEWLLSN